MRVFTQRLHAGYCFEGSSNSVMVEVVFSRIVPRIVQYRDYAHTVSHVRRVKLCQLSQWKHSWEGY